MMSNGTIHIFDLDDTLLITPTFSQLIPKDDNGVISLEGEFSGFFTNIKSFFLIVFSKEVYFVASGDYIVIYDSKTKTPLNPIYFNHMQEFEPDAMSKYGVKNSTLKETLRALAVKDGHIIFESIPGFHTKPETIGKIVNDQVFKEYQSAYNKMILTGRGTALKQQIEARLDELGLDQPNYGLHLFPGGSISIKEYKTKAILDSIRINKWSEVHFYEDKKSWLDTARIAVEQTFPEVNFYPHLITISKRINSL